MSDGTGEQLRGAESEECGMRNVDTQGWNRRNRSPEVNAPTPARAAGGC